MALVGAVEGLADLGGTGGGVNPGGGGKGRLKLDVFLLNPEQEDAGLRRDDCGCTSLVR